MRLEKTDYLGGMIRIFQKEEEPKKYRLFWRWWVR